MRSEEDLRSSLNALERQTPDAETVLRRVAERAGGSAPGHRGRSGRRLLAGAAAASAVVAIAVAATLLTVPRGGTSTTPAQSVPRYYMALVPVNQQSYVKTRIPGAAEAVVKDRFTGRTLATVRPPKPYVTFVGVTGAADDRTFVLTASTLVDIRTQRVKFFYARFNPANDAVALTPLALPGAPVSDYSGGAALSPDGTELAVPGGTSAIQITVYSLPSGAARTWSTRVPYPPGLALAYDEDLSWSGTGTLSFGWVVGSARGGVYLLNTGTKGGSLLADSRDAFCLPYSLPTVLGSSSDFGYLTPDGTTIISAVAQPIPVGQRPPACTQTPPSPVAPAKPELEEFSVRTGRATRVLYTSRSHGAQLSEVYWSNPSGSVLVLIGELRPGPRSPLVFGILSGGRFTPIPGSVIPPLIFDLAF